LWAVEAAAAVQIALVNMLPVAVAERLRTETIYQLYPEQL
jgi:hypothetical protein